MASVTPSSTIDDYGGQSNTMICEPMRFDVCLQSLVRSLSIVGDEVDILDG